MKFADAVRNIQINELRDTGMSRLRGVADMCSRMVLALDLVWTIADVLNAFMAIPNLIAVLLLSGVIAAETKHYLKHLDEKDESEIPVVDR